MQRAQPLQRSASLADFSTLSGRPVNQSASRAKGKTQEYTDIYRYFFNPLSIPAHHLTSSSTIAAAHPKGMQYCTIETSSTTSIRQLKDVQQTH